MAEKEMKERSADNKILEEKNLELQKTVRCTDSSVRLIGFVRTVGVLLSIDLSVPESVWHDYYDS